MIIRPTSPFLTHVLLSIDYFHNISVVNTQYERILINAVHMTILLLDIQPWKWVYFSQVYLFDCWCIWENFCGIHNSLLSAFQFTVLISSDLQWLAKLVLVVQLWSLHKISDQKKNFVEGEWWTVGGVWPHGHCTCLWMSSSLGSSPGWGHCAVFCDTTLISLYPGV